MNVKRYVAGLECSKRLVVDERRSIERLFSLMEVSGETTVKQTDSDVNEGQPLLASGTRVASRSSGPV